MATSTRTPKPRTHRPTKQAEASDQRLARGFQAAVADLGRLVTNAHETDTISELTTVICARHRYLNLDPTRVRSLMIATCACFANLLSRR